jgi:hypothetical protein
MKKRSIKLIPFHAELHILQGKREEIEKKYNRIFSNHDAVTFWNDETSDIYVWFENSTPGIIAHEALHVVNMTLMWAGVIADFENDETQAYLLCYVVNRITETIKPLENKK